jgi:hypothetical protein
MSLRNLPGDLFCAFSSSWRLPLKALGALLPSHPRPDFLSSYIVLVRCVTFPEWRLKSLSYLLTPQSARNRPHHCFNTVSSANQLSHASLLKLLSEKVSANYFRLRIYRGWKALSWMSSMSESPCGFSYSKKWRAESLQHGLDFDSLNPGLKIGIFELISWMNGSFFMGDDGHFLKESWPCRIWHKSRPLTRQLFLFVFTSIVYVQISLGYRAFSSYSS